MDYGDDLNGSPLPGVDHHVGIEIPGPIPGDSPKRRRAAQTFGSLGAVLGNVEENVAEVGLGLWSEPE